MDRTLRNLRYQNQIPQNATDMNARSVSYSSGDSSTDANGFETGWLPSRQDVERQRETAWQMMRQSNGVLETEASQDVGISGWWKVAFFVALGLLFTATWGVIVLMLVSVWGWL